MDVRSEVGRAHAPGALARQTALLAAVGASVALAIGQVVNTAAPGFAAENRATPPERHALILDLVIGAVAGLALAFALVMRRTETQRARLDVVARLAAPLLLTALLPGLLSINPWSDTLFLAVALGIFILTLQPLWRMHFSAYDDLGWQPGAGRIAALALRIPAPLRKHGPLIAVATASLGYIAFMSFLVLRSHAKFNTFNWDLGQLDNQFFNALHGHPFRCTVLIRGGDWSELRNHAEFSLFALLPLYALHPSAETLLVLQAALVGAAALPLYRFAERRLPAWLAALLAISYLLYPPLHGAQLFDFHFQPIAAAFLLAAFDFFDANRMKLFAVFLLLAIGCREDISVGTALFGMLLVLSGYRRREGVLITGVSLAWFVAMRFIVMPAVGTWGFADIYKGLFPQGESSFAGIIKTIVTNPLFTIRTLLTTEKLRYLLQILVPVAFLPIRRPYLAISLLPGAFFTLLTTEYAPTLDIGYQYAGHFVPYIFPAAAIALACIGRDSENRHQFHAAIATLACATLLATVHWGAFPTREKYKSCYGWKTFEAPTESERRRLKDLEELATLVPRDAVLAASDREIPHVSNRLECWNLSAGYRGADYILYTTVDPIPGDVHEVSEAKKAGYVVVEQRPEMVLLKRPGLEPRR